LILGNRIMSEEQKERHGDGSDALPTYSRSPSQLNETQVVRAMRSKFQNVLIREKTESPERATSTLEVVGSSVVKEVSRSRAARVSLLRRQMTAIRSGTTSN
jgi:hypothetical protein